MQLERGITALHRAEQVLIPLQRQIRIVSSLQQELNAADGNRLVDLPEDLVETENVSIRRSHVSIERTEVAFRDADVRVVDVAIDDVGDDAVRVLARTHGVGQMSEQRCRRLAIERERLVDADARSGSNSLRDRFDHQ